MLGKFARLIVCAVCLIVPATVSAQPTTALGRARARAENLTLQLMVEQARRTTARAEDNSSLTALAVERESALVALLDADPGAVWRLAIPAGVRSSLPLEVRSHVESEVTVDGELEILTEDYTWGARVRHYLKTTAGERLTLHLTSDSASWLSGDRARVHGFRIGDALALQPGSNSIQTTTAIASNTFGAQKTLLILVNFQDNQAQPYGTGDAYNVAFGTTSDYDREASAGQTWLTGDVVGWFTIPVSSGGCDTSAIASAAKSAASASGVRLSNYTRFVYAFPNNACAWWGLGSVGGNPSQAWINGNLQLKVLAHEMGHNFGLYHAHSLDCGPDPIGPSCTQSEYGDPIDMMGQEGNGHFSPFAKERLGWLNYGNSPPLTTVTASGSYFIEPYAALTFGQKALKVLQSGTTSGSRTWYYVEYRKGVGFDAPFGSNANLANGVIIRTGSESGGNSSFLLDMTPQTDSWYDTALDVGGSFSDPAAGITITPTSVDASGAWVDVRVGAPACVRAAPSVSISPSATVWTSEGSQLTFKVTVTNLDTTGCTASHFTVSGAISAGWPVSNSAPDLMLDPGASGASDLVVNVPLGTPSGLYSLVTTVTDADVPTLTSSTSVNLGLASSAGLTLTSSATSYSKSQPIPLTATVTVNGQPAQGVVVTFTLTRPDGNGLVVSATTDSAGQAKATFKLKGNYPSGTYRADARASLSGGVTVSGSMSLSIQ